MRRALVLFAPLLLLWALVAELNHALSGWHVYVFVGGLYVGFSALTQPLRPGFAATLLAGFVCDAGTPVVFGTHAVLFGLAHAVVFRLRDRVPRQDNIAATLLTLFTNFGLFLALSFTQFHSSAPPAALWPRLLADLVGSQIVVVLITPWFFALQGRAIELVETVVALRSGRSG
jgi:rod shape-determining protein MreD